MSNDNRSNPESKPKYISFGNKEIDKEVRKRFNKLVKLNDKFNAMDSAPLVQLAVNDWNLELLTVEMMKLAPASSQRAKVQRAHTECQKNVNALRKSLCLAYDERTKNMIAVDNTPNNPLKSLL